MGIDGVGKPGPTLPGATPVDSVKPAEGKSFKQVLESGQVDGTQQVGASDELARLAKGELTIDQYLDARVESAVSHLQGQLDAGQLAYVKETLREQLSTDPVLVNLVQRATGVDSSQL